MKTMPPILEINFVVLNCLSMVNYFEVDENQVNIWQAHYQAIWFPVEQNI